MDIAYNLVTDTNKFAEGMKQAAREAKKTEKSLDELIRKMELQQKTQGQSANQVALGGLEQRGASEGNTSAKFEYAQQLADALDAETKALEDKAEAEEEAAKVAKEHAAAQKRAEVAGQALIISLQREKIALEQGEQAARRFDIVTSKMSQGAKQAALAKLAQNAAIRESNAAEAQATAAALQAKAAADRQAASGASVVAGLKQETVMLEKGALAAKKHAIETSNLSAADKTAALAILEQNAALRAQAKIKLEADAKEAVRLANEQRKVQNSVNLIASLQKEKVALEQGAAASRSYEISEMKLTATGRSAALAIVAEIEALRNKKLAEDQATAAAQKAASVRQQQTNAGLAMIQSLQREKIVLTEGTMAARIYDIAHSNLSTTAKNTAIALMTRNAALEKGVLSQQRDAEAKKQGIAAGRALVLQLQQQGRALAGGQAAVDLHNLALSRIPQRYQAAARALIMMNAELQRTQNRMSGAASGKNLFAVQALAFGIQDFAQVYKNTGLAGGVSAVANNIIFMTSILSPHLAIVTAVTIAVGQLAAVLIPVWMNTGDATKKFEEHISTLRKLTDAAVAAKVSQHEFAQALKEADSASSAKSMRKKVDSELDAIEVEIAAREAAAKQLAAERNKAEDKILTAQKFQSTVGRVATNISISSLPGTKERDAIVKEMQKEFEKINELQARQEQLKGQREKAIANETQRDREDREAKSRKDAREQEQKDNDAFFSDREKRIAKELEAQKKFETDVRKMREENHLETLNEHDKRRARVQADMDAEKEQIREWANSGRLRAHETQELWKATEAGAAKQLADITAAEQEERRKLDDKESAKEKKRLNLLAKEPGENKAIETNSSEGYKRVFEALGQQFNAPDPQKQLIVLQTVGNKIQGELLTLAQAQAREKKLWFKGK